MQEKISSMITILKWLINGADVETVFLLSRKQRIYGLCRHFGGKHID